jgi:hypothetical protein
MPLSAAERSVKATAVPYVCRPIVREGSAENATKLQVSSGKLQDKCKSDSLLSVTGGFVQAQKLKGKQADRFSYLYDSTDFLI